MGARWLSGQFSHVRDSGIVHALLGLGDQDAILGHPIVGPSWETFVIETLISVAPAGTSPFFYRTAAGAEIDLILTPPDNRVWAIEVKRSLSPKLDKGFYIACEDLQPTRKLVVYTGKDSFPMSSGVEAISLSA